jgi:thiamine biosynthesis lipoprotein
MDTLVEVDTFGEDLTESIQAQVEALNLVFDRHSPTGELYALNSNGTLKNSYLADLITKTLALNNTFGYGVDITSGALVDVWNITSDTPKLPTSSEISQAMDTLGIENISLQGESITLNNGCVLDVGAVAKGYTLDVISQTLTTQDPTLNSACVSMGSSTLLYNVDNYTIGIRSPNETNSLACEFTVNGTGYVSTSGGYERYMEIDGVTYSHILDLSTGYPSTTDLTSVTVYTTTSGLASDFLSTCIYLGGTANLENYLYNEDFKVIAIDSSNNIYTSNGLEVNILDSSFKAKY